MGIKCCKGCVPPNRYPGCHDECEKYKEEKAKAFEVKTRAYKERVNDNALNKMHIHRSRKLHDAGLRNKYR